MRVAERRVSSKTGYKRLTGEHDSMSRPCPASFATPQQPSNLQGARLKHTRLATVGLDVSAFPAQRPFRSP